jgi:hypothetical protein
MTRKKRTQQPPTLPIEQVEEARKAPAPERSEFPFAPEDVVPRASTSRLVASAPPTPRPPPPPRPPSRGREVADLFADARRVGR